ncbi:unnamed protein product [Cunninghamella blakesleeana]
MKIFTIQAKERKQEKKSIHQKQYNHHHHHHNHHVPSSFDWIKNWWYRQMYQPPLWCFRIVQNEINNDHELSSSPTSLLWQPFSKYNQRLIWEAAREHMECQIQDPFIYNGKEVIRIMVQEEIAFVFNPEWSHPIIYDIALLPVPPVWTWKYYRKNEKQRPNQT